MELFSELYGCYYRVVAKILEEAHGKGISRARLEAIVQEYGFEESGLHLVPSLINGEWDLLFENSEGLYQSKLMGKQVGKPLTHLQKSWLKAIAQDEKFRLFLTDAQIQEWEVRLKDVEPLFLEEDFHYFDRARDGDPYKEEGYRNHFQEILHAIECREALLVEYQRNNGRTIKSHILPVQMQYSEKDNKFRVLAGEIRPDERVVPLWLNMGRVLSVQPSSRLILQPFKSEKLLQKREKLEEVTLRISQERNALQRSLVQFAFYDKVTHQEENGHGYICRLRYHKEEESELLIRILSFGPVVQVVEPESFVGLMREKIRSQQACFEFF